jgi:dienelactone hydrolase
MKRIVYVVAGLMTVAVLWYVWIGGAAGLVKAAIPVFPELPTPDERLAEDASGTIYFPSATPVDFDVLLGDFEQATPTTGMGTLMLPDGASSNEPVAAMIILPGSGGITPGREMDYGRLLADNGIATFVVDFYTPRGVTDEINYMLKVISVTEFDVITDAYSALNHLATHPAIDSHRIGLMGFSYGGMATRFAMDERLRNVLAPELPGFATFVDFYGPCFQKLGTARTNSMPLLTLRGTEDASNDLEACAKREAELEQVGVEVETHVYQGAGHAWEASVPRALRKDAPYVAGCEIEYDEEGHSRLGDEYIVNVPVETSREERIAIRLASGGVMRDCVKYGYIIGLDDATKTQGKKDLLAFLNRTLEASR